jgi:tetratricopeptide (TPR) repeat protein
VQARGGDPIVVARDAAGQLLGLLGRPARLAPAEVADLPLTELSQRIEASMLAGDVGTASQLLEAASSEQQALPELRLRSAQIDYQAGRTEAAYRKLTVLRDEIGVESDPVLRARILSKLGSAARVLGYFAAAQSAFDEAIVLLEGQHEPVTLGQIYVGRSISYIEQGQYAAASDDFSLARTVFQSIDDQFELAMAEYCEGLMENRRNHPLSSLPIFERVAERFEQFGALNELAHARSNQVLTQYNLLRHTDAIATSDRVLPLLGHLQSPLPRHQLQYARAMSLAAVGRLTEARASYAELAAHVDPVHESRIAAMIRLRQADIELQAGDAEAAHAIARQVSGMPARPDTALIRASGWLTVVQSLVKMGRSTETDEQVQQFAAWADAANNRIAVLYSRLAQAEQAQASGRHDAALSLYANAMLSVEREGVPADVAMVAVSYGRALIAAGDLARASTIAGRVTRYAEQDFTSALLLVELYHATGKADAWRTALDHARTLAGERSIPPQFAIPPRSHASTGPVLAL